MTPAEPGAGSPEVSFVIIAYNEEPRIAATLSSIAAQQGLTSFELIVVDDGSCDGTSQRVQELGGHIPELRLIRHEHNLGRGAARASGIEAARGRWIAMGDGDIVFPPHWWSTCRSYLDDYDAVGGTAVPDGDVAYVHQRTRLVPRVAPPACTITGSNGAFRGEVLRSVTYERTLVEGEDVALNHSLERAGYRLFAIPGLTVEHREEKSFGQAVRWIFVSGLGATRQLWRYRKVRLPDVAAGGWFITAGAAAFQSRRPWRVLGLLVGYSLAAATAHVCQRFEVETRRPGRMLHGVAVDAVLLTSYFLGRCWGVPVLVARSRLVRDEA